MDLILKKLRYSILIRIIITCYLKMALASFLNFGIALFIYPNYILDFILQLRSWLFFIVLHLLHSFCSVLPSLSIRIHIQKLSKGPRITDFQNRFDSLFKEFAIRKGIMHSKFYSILLFRPTIFGAIIVFLWEYPKAQLVLIQISTLLVCTNYFMHIYICY